MPESSSQDHGGQQPRDASPPPPYSETPPPLHATTQLSEQTPLLGRPVIVIRGNITYTWYRPSYVRERSCWDLKFKRCTACALMFMFSTLILLCVILPVLPFLLQLDWLPSRVPPPIPTYSVAIIGAGPAGIAAAQHLKCSQAAQGVHFNITVYEAKPHVGGQLALNGSQDGLVYPYDDPRQEPMTAEDIAGTALLWNNALFTQDSEDFLGGRVEFSELGSQQVGYYRGEDDPPVTTTTRPYSKTPTVSWMRLIWRYGKSVWQAGSMASAINFREKMPSTPLVDDIAAILHGLGDSVLEAAGQWANATLDAHGIGEPYRTEVLDPQVRRMYGEGLAGISGLAMLLAVAQEDSANVVLGGNLVERLQRIVRRLHVDLRTSTLVTGLRPAQIDEEGHSAWLVEHRGVDGSGSPSVEAFDKVLMAAMDERVLYANSSPDADDAAAESDINMDVDVEIESFGSTSKSVFVTFLTTQAKHQGRGSEEDQVLFVKDGAGGDSSGRWQGLVNEIACVRVVTRLPRNGDVDDDDKAGHDDHESTQAVEYLYRMLSTESIAEVLKLDPMISWSHETKVKSAVPYLLPMSRFPPIQITDDLERSLPKG
ncbi:Uu.00g046800.m01.CDS01 [Anthostomella pinea]|uniref:Uu.00g046800.m01.CDS01 n=1 Tax=Anthostomella pinea TaxID=933095 RepID=A0AAI8YEJ4_9PEZI|nr:Uu.00g046800.m01.CDS01 [Anthostomella pinea]